MPLLKRWQSTLSGSAVDALLTPVVTPPPSPQMTEVHQGLASQNAATLGHTLAEMYEADGQLTEALKYAEKALAAMQVRARRTAGSPFRRGGLF